MSVKSPSESYCSWFRVRTFNAVIGCYAGLFIMWQFSVLIYLTTCRQVYKYPRFSGPQLEGSRLRFEWHTGGIDEEL